MTKNLQRFTSCYGSRHFVGYYGSRRFVALLNADFAGNAARRERWQRKPSTFILCEKKHEWIQGCNQLFISGGGNFHEISFDDVIVLIQLWYNFFANGHRYSSLRNISENQNFSVLIKMQTERSGQSKN